MIVGDLEIRLMADLARIRRDMDGARNIVGNATSAIGHMAGIAGMALGAMAGALTISAFTGWIKGAIDAADSASKLSAKTGVAVKDIAGLQLAFDLAGTEGNTFATSMARMSKSITEGNSAFAAMGIKTAGVNGALASNKEVMWQLADAFAKMDDGARKTSLAMEIFGKSGADLIPLLNGGADGFRQMDEMASKLGLTLSDSTAKSAEAFNDTLDMIALGGQGVARGIAAEMLPTLSGLTAAFLESMTSGDKLKKVSDFLATSLKLLFTVGVGIVEVFSNVGKTLGAAGAQLVAILQGDFKMAAQIGREWSKDIGESWADAAKSISDAWAGEGAAALQAQAKIVRAQKDLLAQQKAREEAAKKAAEAQKQEGIAYATFITAIGEKIAANKLELAGVASLSEAQKLTIKLDQSIASGKNKLTPKHIEEARAMIATVAAQDQAIERSKEMAKIQAEYAASAGKSVEDANREAAANEELVRTYGLTKSAIEELEIARLQDRLERLRGIDMADDEVAALELVIAAKKRSAAALGSVEALDASKKATDKFAADQKSMWDSIDQTAHDTFVSIFDSGKSAFDRLRDSLKNGLLDLLYSMTIKKWIFNIGASVTGSAASGLAQAANTASSAGSLIGTAGNIYSTISGGMTLAGGLGSGFMGSLAGGLNGAGIGSGLTSATGLAMGESIAGVVGPQVAGAISSGMSTLAAAAPYLAAALAAYALYKHFDSGNTPHTGGASMATSAGASTIRAESIGFEDTKVSASANQMTAALASGVVSILDSTALAFGKTAGYSAATAFADDSSKDGAWGSLVINKLGEKIVNWQDTRAGGSWAPKVFADGDAGQAQYLAALSASVRTALDNIGLPAWASKMLDGVGAGASIEDLAKVVDQINKTQTALKMMGDSIAGFAAMSDQATTALIEASGGIDSLATNASAYYNAFYTDAEKSSSTIKAISDVLAAAGVAMPASQSAFRATVEAQMAMGEAGAPAVAALLKVAGAFAQVVPAIEATSDATLAAKDILAQQADLQKQLDQLTLTSTQLRAKERMAIDASNLALFDQITNLQTIAATSDALKTSIDKLKTFKDGILSFRDSLTLGSLSTLNPMQKAAEAQRQYEDMLAKARAGDATAQAGIQGAATAYLTADQIVKASSDAYVNDAMKVQADMMALADIAGAQMSVDQLQLTALDSQVAGIASLNSEVKGLREDNAKLREDNAQQRADNAKLLAAVQEQTAAMVAATFQAADSNADKVNKGTMNAGQSARYKADLYEEAIPR